MISKKYLYVAFLLLFYLVPIHADVLLVPENYETIDSAVFEASSYDTLVIEDGVYVINNINIRFKSLVIASNLLLDGDTTHVSNTRLDGDGIDRHFQITGPFNDTTRFIGLTFTNGYSTEEVGDGGSIRADSTTVTIEKCVFINNTGEYYSVGNFKNANLVIKDSKILSNQANPRKFAIGIEQGHIESRNTEYINNIGSGILGWFGSSGHIIQSRFEGNVCTYDSGALNITGNTWRIEQSEFINNQAEQGGAIAAFGCDSLLIYDCLFDSNRAVENEVSLGSFAGAVYIVGGGTPILERNVFRNNWADRGTIYSLTNATYRYNQFIENSGSVCSVMFLGYDGAPNPQIFERNLFSGNFQEGESPVPIHYYGILAFYPNTTAHFHECDFFDNEGPVFRGHENEYLSLTNNYWGDASGPYHPLFNTAGEGDVLDSTVADTSFLPFATEHFFAPNIELDTNEVAFGNAMVGETVSRTIQVTNNGVQHLKIWGLLCDDPAFSLFLRDDTLGLDFGETATVQSRFTPTGEGPHEATARFESNDPEGDLETLQFEGIATSSGVADDEHSDLPNEFQLEPSHPNPFNAQTRVTVAVPVPSHLKLSLFNILGREVMQLVDELYLPGVHTFALNAADLPSGTYLLRASTGRDVRSQTLVLVK
ncbi:T9SS type A sorting domain-containing protein [bacterium]|nr:T9SS type A sorting domain-containing protein [bacterium]